MFFHHNLEEGSYPRRSLSPPSSHAFRWFFFLSLFFHISLVLAFVLTFPSDSPPLPPVEMIPVDLVSISDISKKQATSKTAEKPPEHAKIAPLKTEQTEKKTPPVPKIAKEIIHAAKEPAAKDPTPPEDFPVIPPVKTDSAAQIPLENPEEKPQKAPPPPEKPTPKPKSPSTPPKKPHVTPEKQAPAKQEKTAAAIQPLDDFLKKNITPEPEKKPIDKDPITEEIQKEKPKPHKKPPPKIEKKAQKKPKNTLNVDELSALLNKTDEAPQAPPPPSLETGVLNKGIVDSLSGADDHLSADLLDALRQKISQCWTIPAGARDGATLLIKIEIKLNEDGSLAEYPVLLNTSSHPAFDAAARSAQAAIEACAPYSFLPRDKYAIWQDVILNFDPSQMMSVP